MKTLIISLAIMAAPFVHSAESVYSPQQTMIEDSGDYIMMRTCLKSAIRLDGWEGAKWAAKLGAYDLKYINLSDKWDEQKEFVSKYLSDSLAENNKTVGAFCDWYTGKTQAKTFNDFLTSK